MQWYTLCRYNFYISCRYSGGNDILLSGGQLILCRLWFRWWYSGLLSRCRTAVGLHIRCLLRGSPLWCFGTRLPIGIMLLLSIDVFSWSFLFFRTTVNGLRTTVGRSRLFFRLQVHETTRLQVAAARLVVLLSCCLA